jgi:hypothetical protein
MRAVQHQPQKILPMLPIGGVTAALSHCPSPGTSETQVLEIPRPTCQGSSNVIPHRDLATQGWLRA